MTIDPLILEDWDVWHNFSTYLTVDQLNLVEVAEALTASGFAEVCVHSDGEIWWRDGIGASKGRYEYGAANGSDEMEVRLPRGLVDSDSDGYSSDAAYQGVCFVIEERHSLRPDEGMPQVYVRAFLAPIRLYSSKTQSTLVTYPTLKIFQNGIVLIAFRVSAPQHKIDHTEFLSDYVNCSLVNWASVDVSPALSQLAPLVYAMTTDKNSLLKRVISCIRFRKHKIAVEDLTTRETIDGTEFSFAPLSSSTVQGDTLPDIAQTLFSVVGYLIGRGNSVDWLGIVFNFRKFPQMGKRWVGRPSIFLMKFDGQELASADNKKKFATQFGQLLARSNHASDAMIDSINSNDLRVLEDFSFFAARSAFLMVWSSRGIESFQDKLDRNRRELNYRCQVLIELIAYGDMLHHRILNECERSSNVSMVHKYRKDLLRFEVQRKFASAFGDVTDLLTESWSALGISEMRVQLSDAIKLKEDELSLNESRKTNLIGIVIAVLFGLAGAPSLAEAVTGPVWLILGLPKFFHPIPFDLFMTLLTIVLLMLTSFAGIRLTRVLAGFRRRA